VWKDFSQGGVLTYKHLDTSIKTASSYGNSTGFFLVRAARFRPVLACFRSVL